MVWLADAACMVACMVLMLVRFDTTFPWPDGTFGSAELSQSCMVWLAKASRMASSVLVQLDMMLPDIDGTCGSAELLQSWVAWLADALCMTSSVLVRGPKVPAAVLNFHIAGCCG